MGRRSGDALVLPPGSQLWSFLVAAGVVAGSLVWAETRQYWLLAQASLITVELLLAGMVWLVWRANRNPAMPLNTEAKTYDQAIRKLVLCVIIGSNALLINASRWDHWEYGVVAKAIGYGTLVAGAFFVIGILLGFLFGLRPTSAPQSSSTRPHPYTNLEEIADWLTKIILGAGLIELKNLQNPIKDFAAFVARGVDPLPPNKHSDPGSPAIALAIMGFFASSGILYGYLWTRYEHAINRDEPSPDTSVEHGTTPTANFCAADSTAFKTVSAAGDQSAPGAVGAIGTPVS
jgi:hypothetical protein